jgi:hypothetical protein
MLNECWIATLSWIKIVLCAHFKCNVALHVDTTTSANDTYKISQKSAEDISEDQMNVTKGLSEAPNQSSEDNCNIQVIRQLDTKFGCIICMRVIVYISCTRHQGYNCNLGIVWLLEYKCVKVLLSGKPTLLYRRTVQKLNKT